MTYGLQAQRTLSPGAEISLITCGPGQNELYSAFGHSAVRVRDPRNGLDWVFNYGTFDFDQPNFYLNFARGNLLYQLTVSEWTRFFQVYAREGRFVHQQVLDLDSAQAQHYFDFLLDNAAPENKDYYYDYFYDNCATRIRDGLEETLGGQNLLLPEESHYQPSLSIRDLCDEYLKYQAWGDLGIDICLGMPMDKIADLRTEMFLPDLQEYAFAKAQIKTGTESRPLVREFRVLREQTAIEEAAFFTPLYAFSLLLVIVVGLTVTYYQSLRRLRWFDTLFFLLNGLLGLFLMGLWFLTNHQAAAWNFNLLIFLPFHLLVFPSIRKARFGKWSRLYLQVLPFFYAIVLASWLFLPQELHLAWLPWIAILMLRSWHISYKTPKA